MITNPRQHIRELTMRRIITARKESATSKFNAVRQFRVPSLHFNAQDYIDNDIVFWQNIDRLEPSLMKHISDEDLQECVKTKNFYNVAQFPRFPCHTQRH